MQERVIIIHKEGIHWKNRDAHLDVIFQHLTGGFSAIPEKDIPALRQIASFHDLEIEIA